MVEFILGKREQISEGEESSYGSPVAPTNVFAREARFDPDDNQNWQEIRGAGNDSIDIEEREVGIKQTGGRLTFSPQNWIWLKHVLGDGSSDVTDNDEGTYYSHTFTNAVDISSFTLERAMNKTTTNDHVLTYEGCQVNTATISFDSAGGEGGSLVQVVLDVMNQDVNAGTSVTSLSEPTTKAFQARNAILTLNNSEITELVGGTINIENNLNDARYANYTLNRTKGESAPTVRRVSGTFRIKVKDDTYFDLWDTADVIANTSLVLRRGTNDDLTLTLNEFRIDSPPDPTNLDGINELTLNWTAKSVSAVANDSISSY